jgi:hypothetical protein
LSLDELVQKGEQIDDAHRGRLIDVPLPASDDGIFEDLHGFKDKAKLTKHLIDIALEHHGVASLHFLAKLTEWRARDEKGLRRMLARQRRIYLRQARRLETFGRDLTRIHEKFATIYAAGRLAMRFRLLPWGLEDLRDALLACEWGHIEHIQAHLSAGDTEKSGFQILQEHIRNNRDQFVDLRKGLADPDHDPASCLGYINKHQGKTEYLFTEQRLASLVGGKNKALQLKQDLHDRGLIATTEAGSQGVRYVAKRKLVAGKGPQSVTAVDAAILEA